MRVQTERRDTRQSDLGRLRPWESPAFLYFETWQRFSFDFLVLLARVCNVLSGSLFSTPSSMLCSGEKKFAANEISREFVSGRRSDTQGMCIWDIIAALSRREREHIQKFPKAHSNRTTRLDYHRAGPCWASWHWSPRRQYNGLWCRYCQEHAQLKCEGKA